MPRTEESEEKVDHHIVLKSQQTDHISRTKKMRKIPGDLQRYKETSTARYMLIV